MAYRAVFRERVRSFHLDIYGHVNNAVYMQWFEHGRSQLLQDKGFDYVSITPAWGVRLVTVATNLNYRAQLGLDHLVEISTEVIRMGRTSVTYRQVIERVEANDQRTVCADAETTICFTDPEMKGAVPIPEEFRRLYG